MRNLYITDLKRIFKDKLFLVTCILATVFALINPLLNKAIFELLGINDLLGSIANSKSMLFTAFAPGDNLGLILPILICIIVCKDFSQGTVRNKIISGKPRLVIYVSHLLASATIVCGIMLLHGLLTLGVALMFFPYQETAFTFGDFGYLMLSLLFEMFTYFAVSAIVTFIATNSKNMGVCIVLYLAVCMGFSIVGAIFQVSIFLVEYESTAYKVLEFINALNLYTSNFIGQGTTYNLKQVLYILMSPAIMIAGSTLLGIKMFLRKNLK